jgi:hypothetical protein
LYQSGFTLNGRQIVQEAQFLRAAYSTFFSRGNRSITLSFSVSRLFGSVENAELFMLGHYASLSDGPASLVLTCGSTNVFVADAVLESVSEPVYVGCSVTVQYHFRAPRILTAYSLVTTDFDAMTQSGSQSIPAGVSSHSLTGLAFPSVPIRILGTVALPAGEDIIVGGPVIGSETTDGFDIVLSAITPSANYRFNYVVVL